MDQVELIGENLASGVIPVLFNIIKKHIKLSNNKQINRGTTNMKKTLAIIVVVIMMAAFTGCKGDSPSEEAAMAIEEAKELFK